MKVEAAVLGSSSLTVLTVSVDIKQHCTIKVSEVRSCVKVEVGRPGLPVPNSPYGLCGRKAAFEELQPGSNCTPTGK